MSDLYKSICEHLTSNMMQFPIISCTQKIVVYETKTRFYVVGSNNTETRFRVLKIDRTEPKELHIVDDKVEYSRRQIRDLLMMIDQGNRLKFKTSKSPGLTRTVSAFGIVGFVRFLDGYYMILITKRKRVALIGHHFIYKIEDTSMLYLPNTDTVRQYPLHADEQKYLKMFQNVDLSSNFYFSYSYDLSHTLQYNMSPCKGLENTATPQSPESQLKFWSTWKQDNRVHDTLHHYQDIEDASATIKNFLDKVSGEKSPEREQPKEETEDPSLNQEFVYGVRTAPTWRYIWNMHLLRQVQDLLHPDWLLYVTHGFIGQSNVLVFGRPVYLTLIARRSNQYAGTRFLKRGANAEGYVANEVETEQIVHNVTVTGLDHGDITSFVQLRGSIPLFWSQDISKMVPKPTITMDQTDPYGHIAGQHFNRVLRRYGSPCIILNLVKKRESKKHESTLSEEVIKSLHYLNQLLPPDHTIKYIGFDMARVSKSKTENVMLKLAEIAEYCIKKTGFFSRGKGLYCNQIRPHARCKGMQREWTGNGFKQQGVVRTNCVDCLDRTNTAQFAIGKCALAFQLYTLGILDQPYLEFDTDCVRMLEDLYEDQGDTLAVQYGGSQLVHRIKGYRNLAPWTSSSRDIMHTLSRYYSNAFSDTDKQHAINLFLGVYRPGEGLPSLWELPTDFYLHNKVAMFGPSASGRERSYTQWWELPVCRSLPFPYDEEGKGLETKPLAIRTLRDDERVDMFWEYYKPFELTSLDEVYSFCMPNSTRDFMPKFANTYSPFSRRVRPGRRQEEYGSSTTEANPNVTGKDSTSSTASTGSEGSSSSSEGSDIEGDIVIIDDHDLPKDESGLSLMSLKDLFPTMAQTYGVEILPPNKEKSAIYKKYVDIGKKAVEPVKIENGTRKAGKTTELVQTSIFPLDSSYSVEPPIISPLSREIYETHARRGQRGAEKPPKHSMLIYHRYLLNKYQ